MGLISQVSLAAQPPDPRAQLGREEGEIPRGEAGMVDASGPLASSWPASSNLSHPNLKLMWLC